MFRKSTVKIRPMKMAYLMLAVLMLTTLLSGCAKREPAAAAQAAAEQITTQESDYQGQEQQWNALIGDADQAAQEAKTFLEGIDGDTRADIRSLSTLDFLILDIQNMDHSVPAEAEIEEKINELSILNEQIRTVYYEAQAEVAAYTEEKQNEALWTTASYEFSQDDGYQYEVTVKYSQLIPVEEWDVIEGIWSQIGKGNELPTMNTWGFTHYEGSVWMGQFGTTSYEAPGDEVYTRANSMYYLMGTAVFENKTEGWPLSETNKGSPMMYIMDTGNGWTNYAVGRIYYSSTYELFDSNILFRPSMSTDKTGEIPFVIGLVEYYAPDYPDGAYRGLYETEDFLKISLFDGAPHAMPTTFYEQ